MIGRSLLSLGIKGIAVGLALYLVLCGYLYTQQARFIFFPRRAIARTPAAVGLVFEDVWIPVEEASAENASAENASAENASDEDLMHGWWIPAGDSPLEDDPLTLLYFHGNAANVGDLVDLARQFHDMGLAVLLVDYRGYGRSQGGFPSQESVYADAEAAWRYLVRDRQRAPHRIVLYGHSLGGAIALWLAAQQPQAGAVIAEASFTSVGAIAQRIPPYRLLPIDRLLTQRFDALAAAQQMQVPVLFLHGTADVTVPPDMSETLYEAATEPKELWLVPQANHNTVPAVAGAAYPQRIQQFLNRVVR